ncbi:AMP-binding protein [Nocardia tengchongensis]
MAGGTLAELLERLAGYRNGIHFPESGEVLEYRHIPELAYGLANDLLIEGVTGGDIVGILAPACPGFFQAYFGAIAAGAATCVLPVPSLGADLAERLAPMLEATGIRHVVVAGAFGGFASALSEAWGIPVLRAEDSPPGPTPPAALAEVDTDQVAMMTFTSGSVGRPKGVQLTHDAICEANRDVAEVCGLSASDVFCSWLPLSHDFGINTVLIAMFNDAALHQFNPVQFIRDTQGFLRHIGESGATVVPGPNFGFERMAAAAANWTGPQPDLSRWRMAWSGGEVVQPVTVTRFRDSLARFGLAPTVMSPAYGMAEFAGPICGIPEPERWNVVAVRRDSLEDGGAVEFEPADATGSGIRQIISSGPGFGRTRIRIVDRSGKPLPDRHFGEIEARGPGQMSGYRTAAQPLPAGEPGWFATGDTGFVHDGELYIAGRRKEMIIVAGRNFHAEDVEQIAGAVPGVYKGHAAAIADTLGERIVVFAESVAPDGVAEQVRAAVAEQLGLARVDVRVVGRGELPRTTSGKWRRQELRERLTGEAR